MKQPISCKAARNSKCIHTYQTLAQYFCPKKCFQQIFVVNSFVLLGMQHVWLRKWSSNQEEPLWIAILHKLSVQTNFIAKVFRMEHCRHRKEWAESLVSKCGHCAHFILAPSYINIRASVCLLSRTADIIRGQSTYYVEGFSTTSPWTHDDVIVAKWRYLVSCVDAIETIILPRCVCTKWTAPKAMTSYKPNLKIFFLNSYDFNIGSLCYFIVVSPENKTKEKLNLF